MQKKSGMTRRATRTRFKPYVDKMRKEISGFSIAKYLESPSGISQTTPEAKTRLSQRLFDIGRKDFELKEGGWSIARRKENE